MIDANTAQAVYNDMGALADLRGRARANPNEAVEDVAQQFEALFIQMMLKSMRDAVEDGGLFGSDQLDTYQQMADQQTALDMASKGGIGLAEALVAQLSRSQGQGQDTGQSDTNEASMLNARSFSLATDAAPPEARSLMPREPAAISIYRDAAKSLPLPQGTSALAPRDDAMSK
jgi:flagellar protein FlgJ